MPHRGWVGVPTSDRMLAPHSAAAREKAPRLVGRVAGWRTSAAPWGMWGQVQKVEEQAPKGQTRRQASHSMHLVSSNETFRLPGSTKCRAAVGQWGMQ